MFALACPLVAALVAVCAVSPVCCVAAVPAACVIAYMLGVYGGAFPLAAVAAAFACSAFFAPYGKALFAAAATMLALIAAVRAFRSKLGLWAEIALCAAAGLAGALGVTCVWSAVQGSPLSYTVTTALRITEEQIEEGVLWYVTGFGAFTGGAGCAGGIAAAHLLGAYKDEPRIADMRLSRNYLAAAVVPALAFALLSFYEPMKPVTLTVMNVMVTLPTALCGVTLLYHSLARVRGKPKIAAIIGFWLIIAAAAVFWDYGLTILGFIGLADCVINVRKLLDWALS